MEKKRAILKIGNSGAVLCGELFLADNPEVSERLNKLSATDPGTLTRE